MSLKSSFNQYLLQNYPQLKADVLNQLVSEQLISPFQVSLPSETIENIKKEIKGYWQLRSWSESNLAEKYAAFGLKKPTNYSACMSYDFHVSSTGQLELIEINTNAAFLAMGVELYNFWKLKNPAGDFTAKDIADMFKKEIAFAGIETDSPSVGIFDESPESQRLYVEFLLYKNMFEKNGIRAEILDFQDVPKKISFDILYNRYTDFFLQNEASKEIKDLFNAGKIQLSPNPWEYFLLADKQRLIDWSNQTELPKPASLLPVFDMDSVDRDIVWAQRKNLFFKPKNSFGSKQAYRGSSISKKHFDDICQNGFIAQQISVPAEIDVEVNQEKTKLKYDLRCYAYQDQLQLVVARLYQGQTTNLRTEGGGFACVNVI